MVRRSRMRFKNCNTTFFTSRMFLSCSTSGSCSRQSRPFCSELGGKMHHLSVWFTRFNRKYETNQDNGTYRMFVCFVIFVGFAFCVCSTTGLAQESKSDLDKATQAGK